MAEKLAVLVVHWPLGVEERVAKGADKVEVMEAIERVREETEKLKKKRRKEIVAKLRVAVNLERVMGIVSIYKLSQVEVWKCRRS